MSCTFAIAIKDDANADKYVITASGLIDATAASWTVEMHDHEWPAAKTTSHELKKLENEQNWKVMNISIKPKESARVLVWRARCSTQAWTEWRLLDTAAEKKKANKQPSKWDAIFAEAGYTPPEKKDDKKVPAAA